MRRFAILLLVLLVPSLAHARGSIDLKPTKTKLVAGGQTSMEILVTGKLDGSLELESSPQVRFVQTSQFSDSSMVRGRVQATTSFGLRVIAGEAGTVKVGPLRAMVDGRMIRSNQVEFTVTGASKGGGKGASKDQGGARTGDVYAVATVSDPKPYVGQAIVWHVEQGMAIRARNPQLRVPAFAPLVLDPSVEDSTEERLQVLDGRRYTIFDSRVALFAVEPGAVRIGPATASVDVVRSRRTGMMDLRMSEAMPFDSNAIELTVRPLPKQGRPDGFTGSVGRYRLVAALDSPTVEAGATVTLELRLAGEGSLRNVQLVLPPVDGLKVYDEDPDQRGLIVDGAVQSQVIARRTLVPLKPGDFTIPAIEFSFFNPKSARYERTKSQPVQLVVTGDAVVDPAVLARSTSASKAQVEVLGSDILPLHDGDRMLGDARRRIGSPLVLGLLLLPMLGFVGLFSLSTRERMAGTDAGRERTRRKVAKGAAGEARRAAKTGDWEAAEGALRDFLSARLTRSGAALSSGDAEAALREAGGPMDAAQALAVLLDRIEGVRYGGASSSGLADAIADWIGDVEGRWS